MKRLIAILALVAASFGIITTVAPSPASALTGCTVNTAGTYGYSICSTNSAFGLNLQRVHVTCNYYYEYREKYGPWVGRGVYSVAYCDPGWVSVNAVIQKL